MKSSAQWSHLLGLLVPVFALGCSSTPSDPAGNGGSSQGQGGTSTGNGGSTTTANGGSSTTGNGGSTSTGNGGSTSTSNGGSSTANGGSTSTSNGGSSTANGGASTTEGGSTTTSGGASTTSGGSTTTGTGGGPAMKLCATKSKPTSATFVDFETYDGMASGATWAFSPIMNSYAGFWTAGTPKLTIDILGGHGGNYGATVAATQATGTWSGFGTWMNPVTCLDVSTYTGVTLWVKGTTPNGKFSLSALTDDTTLPATDPAGGGTCTGTVDTCKSPTAADLPVTADWTQVTIPWAMFVGGTNGTTAVTMTGANLTGFTFGFGFAYGPSTADPTVYVPLPGDISFTFDDMAFTQ
ncbi:MAG: hypothetical protein QM756_14710 [Polyangiaceae bacterium]